MVGCKNNCRQSLLSGVLLALFAINTIELMPHPEEPDFGMQLETGADFDLNAAFLEAMHGVASDAELALDEKVRRMEVIVSEGTSEVYRDFVNLGQLAAQMRMMCTHNHDLHQSLQTNESLSTFMDNNWEHDSDIAHKITGAASEDEFEIDPKTGKKTKKKKKRGWFGVWR